MKWDELSKVRREELVHRLVNWVNLASWLHPKESTALLAKLLEPIKRCDGCKHSIPYPVKRQGKLTALCELTLPRRVKNKHGFCDEWLAKEEA